MKALLAVLMWLAVRPTTFQQRWVALPPAMSVQTFNAADGSPEYLSMELGGTNGQGREVD
jgi:hypothetical protein